MLVSTPNLTNNIVLSFQYSFGADPLNSLLAPLEEELLKTTHTYCGKSYGLFTKRLARGLANVNRYVGGDKNERERGRNSALTGIS